MNQQHNLLLLVAALFILGSTTSADEKDVPKSDQTQTNQTQSDQAQSDQAQSDQAFELLDDEPRARRVAILLDCSLSMDVLAEDGRPRQLVARQALVELLRRLPDRTEFVFIGFNEKCLPMHNQFLSLSGIRRRQVVEFAGTMTPRGETLCGECVASVVRRWPRLDSVFVITDAESPNRVVGEKQAMALGRIQQHFGFQLYWLLVDQPGTPNLQRMLQLSRGQRW